MEELISESPPTIQAIVDMEMYLRNRDASYALLSTITATDVHAEELTSENENIIFILNGIPVYDWSGYKREDELILTSTGIQIHATQPEFIQTLAQQIVEQDTTRRLGSTWDVVASVASSNGKYIFRTLSGVKSEQSYPYIFEANGTKFLIKTTPRYHKGVTPLFFEELLRLQQLEKELGPQLAMQGFAFPKIICASGYMFCMEFVDGNIATVDNLPTHKIKDLENLISNFLDSHKEEELWKFVGLDFREFDYGFYKRTGFIVNSETGLIYIIDPFLRLWN